MIYQTRKESKVFSDKTDVIVLVPQLLRNTLSNDILTLDGIGLASSNSIRNLRVVCDQDVSFNSHIKQTSRTALL